MNGFISSLSHLSSCLFGLSSISTDSSSWLSCFSFTLSAGRTLPPEVWSVYCRTLPTPQPKCTTARIERIIQQQQQIKSVHYIFQKWPLWEFVCPSPSGWGRVWGCKKQADADFLSLAGCSQIFAANQIFPVIDIFNMNLFYTGKKISLQPPPIPIQKSHRNNKYRNNSDLVYI